MVEGKRGWLFWGAIGGIGFIAGLAVAHFLLTYFVLSTRARIEWEHGVELPPSARGYRCHGNCWKMCGDRWALSFLEVDTKEYEQQIQGSSGWDITGWGAVDYVFTLGRDPAGEIQEDLLSRGGKVVEGMNGRGGTFLIQVWELGPDTRGLLIYSDPAWPGEYGR